MEGKEHLELSELVSDELETIRKSIEKIQDKINELDEKYL